MPSKVDYVRSQGQTRPHTCHWPGCKRQVPPAMWGCKEHWFKLPLNLRNRIWQAYEPGQEVDLSPSDEYLAVAKDVEAWITATLKIGTDLPRQDNTRPKSG
jgi:hypothetical protein